MLEINGVEWSVPKKATIKGFIPYVSHSVIAFA